MKLISLELQNFVSYKKLLLEFQENGLHLFTGKSGSGKSVIFEAILWATFGRTIKKVKMEELINENEEKNCFVKFSFEKKGVVYKINRYRRHDDYNDELKLFINKKEYQGKDTQTKIESVIGMTDKLFIISNLISNDESSNILNIQRAKRIDIFEEIFGLSGLDDYEKKAIDGIKNINAEIASNINKLIELKTKQEAVQNSIDDYLKNKKVRIGEIKNGITDFETKRDNVDIKEKDKILNTYKIILQKNEELRELNGSVEKTIAKSLISVKFIKEFAEDEINTTNEIKSLKETSKCNVCDSELKGVKYTNLSKSLDKKLIEIKKGLTKEKKGFKQIQVELDNFNKNEKAIEDEREKLIKVFDKLIEKSSLDAVDLDMGLDKAWLKDLENHFDIEGINKKIGSLKDELEELTNDTFVKDAKKRLANIEKEIPEYVSKEKKLKEDLEYWTFWKKAFDVKADSNIKKFRIQKIVTKFNEIIAHYVDKFFPDEDVKLLFRDNLDESIRFNKRQRSYKMLSKGQKKVMDNCVNFAFFEMARLMTKSEFPAIFVDECLDGLDSEKSNAVIDVLSSIARSNVAYVISHDKTIKDSVDSVYEVFYDIDEETSKIKAIF